MRILGAVRLEELTMMITPTTGRTDAAASATTLEAKVAALGTTPLAPNGLGNVSEGWNQALDAASDYAQSKGFLGVGSTPVEGAISFGAAPPVEANQVQEISLFEKGKKHFLAAFSPNQRSAREVYDTIKAAIDARLQPKAQPSPPPTVERVAPELGKQVAALSTEPMAPNGISDVTQGYNRALRVASVYAEKRGIQGLTSRPVEGMVSFTNANQGQELLGTVAGEQKSLGLIIPNRMSEREVFTQMKACIDRALG
jgi:hypothetical protein